MRNSYRNTVVKYKPAGVPCTLLQLAKSCRLQGGCRGFLALAGPAERAVRRPQGSYVLLPKTSGQLHLTESVTERWGLQHRAERSSISCGKTKPRVYISCLSCKLTWGCNFGAKRVGISAYQVQGKCHMLSWWRLCSVSAAYNEVLTMWAAASAREDRFREERCVSKIASRKMVIILQWCLMIVSCVVQCQHIKFFLHVIWKSFLTSFFFFFHFTRNQISHCWGSLENAA